MRASGQGNWKKWLWVLPVVALVAAAAVLLDRFAPGSRLGQEDEPGKTVEDMLQPDQTDEAPLQYQGKWYQRNQDTRTYLVMGIDRPGEAGETGSYIGGGQADMLMLLVLDPVAKTSTILQLNRDTMTEVEVLGVMGDVVGTQTMQLCLAHGYGTGVEDSCENTVRAVSNLLYGTPIDGYAAIQMDAIPILNDAVGGVTVTIEDDFSDVDPSLVQGEEMTLHGQQAYSYLRYRHYVGDSTNLSRMRRHRTYLAEFSKQAQKALLENPNFINTLYQDLSAYMVTDISGADAGQLAQQFYQYTSQGVKTLEGEAKLGEVYMEYYVDEESVIETVLQLFYTETEQPGG